MPYTWPILGISVFAGLFEGVGLALFVPLLALMDNAGAEPSGILALTVRGFDTIGLPVSVTSMVCAITALVMVGLTLAFLHRRITQIAFNSYILTLRHRLMQGVLESTWPHLANRASGEVINNLILETSQTSTGLLMQIQAITAIIQVVILGAISAALSPELILLVVAFSGLILLASKPFLRRTDFFGKGLTRANQEYGHHSVDYLRGANLIKITGSETPTLERIDSLSTQVFRMRLGMDLVSNRFQFMLQSAPVFLVAAIIFVAYEMLGMSSAGILTFLLLIARLMPRVAEVQQRYQSYISYRPAFWVVERMLQSCGENIEEMGLDRPDPSFHHQIEISSATLSYPGADQPALRGVTLTIPKNQMIALVGSSGAGKSTLINVLAGLYRLDSGQILIDGVDLGGVNLHAWRRRIGFVTQDIVTFNDTLRNNLIFAHPEADERAISDVLRIAHLDDFIAGLPEGLDTVVGENGVRLSGGQRQRLALARALIGKPDILLLDEATSALDNETEQIVQQAIETIVGHCTIVVIAHRLSTVRRANRIYVMEDGQTVEAGSYNELIAASGRFAHLHQLQFVE